MSECSVCSPGERAIKINKEISEKKLAQRVIADKYGISYDALRRHIKNGHATRIEDITNRAAKVKEELLAGVTSIKHALPKIVTPVSNNDNPYTSTIEMINYVLANPRNMVNWSSRSYLTIWNENVRNWARFR